MITDIASELCCNSSLFTELTARVNESNQNVCRKMIDYRAPGMTMANCRTAPRNMGRFTLEAKTFDTFGQRDDASPIVLCDGDRRAAR